MAGFRTHIGVSTALGVAVGACAVNPLGFAPEAAILAAGTTAVGGMLPDLDSESGIPLRETFGLAAAALPLMAVPRLGQMGLSMEGTLAFLMGLYMLVRYGGARIFKRFTVHRGMFHSIPAMLIAGLSVYLMYHSSNRSVRILLAGGVMVGFFSHLVLDEIWAVDFNGVRIKLNKFAGSAIKFVSPSLSATLVCYLLLGMLLYWAWQEFEQVPLETLRWPKSR